MWFGISGCCLPGAWHFYRVPVVVCAVTALLGVFGLYRGTLEPFLFALMLTALTREKTRPLHAASLIGLAAAIKIYPVLLPPGTPYPLVLCHISTTFSLAAALETSYANEGRTAIHLQDASGAGNV